jgi:protein SCO1
LTISLNALRRIAVALLVVAGLAGCDKLSQMLPSRQSFKSVDVTGADYGRELALSDAEGRARTLADFKGKVTVVFFGYTHCPDVCPTTLSELSEVKHGLGADGDRVQALFVTVDPERDTPQILKAYMDNFGPGFVALRGSTEQTAAAAREFKVFYAKVRGKTEDSYTIDHTAGSYIIDAKGRLRLFARYGMPAEDLKSDLKQLLGEG